MQCANGMTQTSQIVGLIHEYVITVFSFQARLILSLKLCLITNGSVVLFDKGIHRCDFVWVLLRKLGVPVFRNCNSTLGT